MPYDLRVALWNAFDPMIFARGLDDKAWRRRVTEIYRFLHWPVHTVPNYQYQAREALERWYFDDKLAWYEVYNLFDFVGRILAAQEAARPGRVQQVLHGFNLVLEAEGSPYRFVDGLLTTITDERELQAVRDALAISDKFAGSREHLAQALRLLGQRPEPDYRNAIKESISAVESTLKVLTQQDHATLGEALREFTQTHPIHGALFRGLDHLYGYTSNEHGLRHALLDADANVGFPEAKFMIVACSAFVSFLIARVA